MADEKEPKRVVSFGGDEAYRAKIDQAKKGAAPVGGVPMPKMPRFDQMTPPDKHAGVQKKAGTLTREQMAELQEKGALIPGIGSGYVANQPALRGQQPEEPSQIPEGAATIAPSQPRPAGSGLTPTTVNLLQQAAQQAKTEEAKAKAERESQEKEQAKIEEELEKLDDEFDFDEFGNRVTDILNNKKRREAIEKRCPPLNFRDLLLSQEVRQKVPIIPEEYEPIFRSTTGREDLFVKKLMSGEKGSDPYLLSKMTMLNLVNGWYAINGQLLPIHLVDGKPQEEAFNKKYEVVLDYPVHILADLAANLIWFERRCRKLLVIDEIKGF